MKKIVTFYVLLELKDLEFLSENNFTKLPLNEIPFTFKKDEIENYAGVVMRNNTNILITARLDCDMNSFVTYRDSHPDENPTEFGGLSEVKTNTLNYALIDKIKIESVFGRNLQNFENKKVITFLNNEKLFFERKLREYLEVRIEDKNYNEYHFEEKKLEAGLTKEEKETYESLKQDYFNLQNAIEKLKQ